MSWLSGYSKRKELTLTGGSSGAQTDYQLKISVSYAAAMQGDFDDLRFTQADGETLVDAWAEVVVTDTSATVWVEFPTTPANTVEQDYYMFYGNGSAANYWDIGATFLFGDDFSGTFPGTKWSGDTGYGSVSDGILTYTGNGAWRKIYGNVNTTPDMALRCKAKITSGTSSPAIGFEKTPCCQGRSIVYNTGLLTTDDSNNTEQSPGYWSYATWYIHDLLQISGTSVELLTDDVSKVTHTTRVGTIAQPCHVGSYNSSIEVDWLLARKYVTGPPTYAFGSEESASPTRMVYQGGFNTYKLNSVQTILEDIAANATWYYNMLKRRN